MVTSADKPLVFEDSIRAYIDRIYFNHEAKNPKKFVTDVIVEIHDHCSLKKNIEDFHEVLFGGDLETLCLYSWIATHENVCHPNINQSRALEDTRKWIALSLLSTRSGADRLVPAALYTGHIYEEVRLSRNIKNLNKPQKWMRALACA